MARAPGVDEKFFCFKHMAWKIAGRFDAGGVEDDASFRMFSQV
jgi:hypothetical protein